MRTFLVLILLVLSCSIHAEDKSDSDTMIDLLITAKATGMCGVFAQMVSFQDATKMQGGDEFIVRFLNTEAARLGYDLDSFMKTCPVVVKEYNDTMKVLGGP